MIKSRFASAVLLLAFFGVAGTARAQYFMQNGGSSGSENIQGISVAGKGFVSAKPNLVEVDLDVQASSELTADAIVKYRDAKRRLRDAFTALKLDNVTVEERGLLVDQKSANMNMYFFGGQQNTRSKTEVQLTRKLVVKAVNLRKLDEDATLQLVARLLDVAQDAGGHVGARNNFNPYYYDPYERMNSGGLVRFVVDDFEKLQEEAYEKAIADAKTRAQRLAKLSGVELGPIIAVREVVVPGDRMTSFNPNSDDDTSKKRLETSKLQEIPVRVELLVRFEIRSEPKAKPRVGE